MANILDHVFTIEVPEHPVLGQFSEQEDQMDWADVPALKDHFFFKPQLRLVLENCGITNPTSIEEYIARDGYKAYLDAIKNSVLLSFATILKRVVCGVVAAEVSPQEKKWKFALATEADQKYLICNADEGDPGAFMDRAVIEGDPHKLLEGMALAAYAIGATKLHLHPCRISFSH